MTTTNNACENEKMKQECLGCYEFKRITRKERYEYLFKQINEVKQELQTAKTGKAVNAALDNLEELMVKTYHNSQMDDVKNLVKDVYTTIQSVKLHDITRSVIDDIIQKILDRVEQIIAEENEKEKENSERLRNLFLELAEHADQIAEIVDINKIFG